MNKFKSKKGFTLAELLIVVAIIAVLIAIAVPIFIGALDNARKGVFQANMRSLKGLAVTQILTVDGALKADANADGIWTAQGYWDPDGTLHLLRIYDNKVAQTADKETKYSADAGKDSDNCVTISITKADISKIQYTAPATP